MFGGEKSTWKSLYLISAELGGENYNTVAKIRDWAKKRMGSGIIEKKCIIDQMEVGPSAWMQGEEKQGHTKTKLKICLSTPGCEHIIRAGNKPGTYHATRMHKDHSGKICLQYALRQYRYGLADLKNAQHNTDTIHLQQRCTLLLEPFSSQNTSHESS